ncbi:MAG: hypothetical protein IT458_05000 [Planctomycetes bacterium]|nr:hypothetical protein [Planctomycetota bacterium]
MTPRTALVLPAFLWSAFLSACLPGQGRVAAVPRLEFEPNLGQLEAPVTHVARGPGYAVLAGAEGFALRLQHGRARQAEIAFTPVGGRLQAPLAEARGPGTANYLRGKDPSGWRIGVPRFARLRYPQVHPGIDLILYGNGQELEYDFELEPGARVAAIELRVAGARLALCGDALDLETHVGTLRQRPPVAWQWCAGERREVAVRYELRGADRFGFVLGPHDPSLPLVVDPVLAYATWIGGSNWEYVLDVAADPQGNAYVVGQTASLDFPMAGPIRGTIDGVYDAFVAKLNPGGTALLYATYLGGSGPVYTQAEAAVAVAVDATGEAVITGFTDATDFPTTTGAAQPNNRGGYDAFVCRLNATGSGFVFATYLGGAGRDLYANLSSSAPDGGDVVLDAEGNAIVTGTTRSADLQVVQALQPRLAGDADAYLAVYSRTGTLRRLTYFGGGSMDTGLCLALGPSGIVVLGGGTISADMPVTPGAYDPSTTGRGYVSVFDPTVTNLIGSTRFKGVPQAVGMDATVNVYVAGATSDPGHPVTPGGMVTAWPGAADSSRNTEGFLARFDLPLTTLQWSTLVGIYDSADGIVDLKIDARGYPVVVMRGSVPGASFLPGPNGARVVKMSPDGRTWCSELRFAVGSHTLAGMDLGANGSVWAAGHSSSTATITPGTGAYQATIRGQTDGFVVRVDERLNGLRNLALTRQRVVRGGALSATVTIDGPAPAAGYLVTLNASPSGIAVFPASVTIPAGMSHASFDIQVPADRPETTITMSATVVGGSVQAAFRIWAGPTYALRPLQVGTGEVRARDISDAGVTVGTGLAGGGYSAWRHDDRGGFVAIAANDAVAVSASGIVVGGIGYEQVYRLLPGGTPQTLFANAEAGGVNDRGDIVGTSTAFTTGGYGRAYLWSATGGMQNLGTLGGSASYAYGISAGGLVVGESFVTSGGRRAFLWQQGVGMRDLGALQGHAWSTAYAINDFGEACGISADASYNAPRAVRFEGSSLVDLGVVGSDVHSLAYDLNSHRHAVGFSATRGAANKRAFLYTPSRGMEELRELLDPEEALGWRLDEARAINDLGQIVGQGMRAGSASAQAFRLDPIAAATYGSGCPGASGRVPALAGEGRPGAGETVTLVVARGAASAPAVLLVGASQVDLPVLGTCRLLVGAPSVIGFTLDSSGRARLPVAVPVRMAQGSVFAQVFVADPGSSSGLVSGSNGLELRVR